MDNHKLQILLIGPLATEAWQLVAAQLPGFTTIELADFATASKWLENELDGPSLIIVSQSWPGEIMGAELAVLGRLAPLARVVSVLESWCEGEIRHGNPWPVAIRLYGYQWPQRAARQLAAIARGEFAIWNLPATLTAEEVLLAEGKQTAGKAETVAIVARSPVMATVLEDACRLAGYLPVVSLDARKTRVAHAAVIVWDTSAASAADVGQVEDLRQRCGGAPIVALWGFPRSDEIACAQAAGVAEVVSKPFLLVDLDWQIGQLIRLRFGSHAGSSQVSARSVRRISRRHWGSWIGQPQTR